MGFEPSVLDRFLNESGSFRDDIITRQPDLFRVRLQTREFPPEGGQIALKGRGSDGHVYYCKTDDARTPARMREALYSRIYSRLEIATPGFAIVCDGDNEDVTYFGSREHRSTASKIECLRLLSTEMRDELGRHMPFPQELLSSTYAADMFLGNHDRHISNFVLHQEASGSRRLCPIDFSLTTLGELGQSEKFPVEQSETVKVGRMLRKIHGFCLDSALAIVDELASVTREEIGVFCRDLPSDWVDPGEKGVLDDFWGSQEMFDKLHRLRAGLRNGQLL